MTGRWVTIGATVGEDGEKYGRSPDDGTLVGGGPVDLKLISGPELASRLLVGTQEGWLTVDPGPNSGAMEDALHLFGSRAGEDAPSDVPFGKGQLEYLALAVGLAVQLSLWRGDPSASPLPALRPVSGGRPPAYRLGPDGNYRPA
jgi:hypothetical protein